MDFWKRYAVKHPDLRIKLRKARMDLKPEVYAKKSFITALLSAIMVTILLFFVFVTRQQNKGAALLTAMVFGLITYILMFFIAIRSVDVKIRKRAKEIDREILFAGRFLIVKLSSGRPLINTLIDASKSYGVGGKFFREIVRDIELGSSVEKALQRATEYSPSAKFKKILFQINNALRVGIDVTKFLTSTLDEISHEQIEEIRRYGKKLSTIVLFYLLFGVVIPSLGISLTAVLGIFTGLELNATFFGVLWFFIIITQLAFIILFKAIRPVVNV